MCVWHNTIEQDYSLHFYDFYDNFIDIYDIVVKAEEGKVDRGRETGVVN